MATETYRAPYAVAHAADIFTLETVEKARAALDDNGARMFPDINFEISGDILAVKRHEDREWDRLKDWGRQVGLVS